MFRKGKILNPLPALLIKLKPSSQYSRLPSTERVTLSSSDDASSMGHAEKILNCDFRSVDLLITICSTIPLLHGNECEHISGGHGACTFLCIRSTLHANRCSWRAGRQGTDRACRCGQYRGQYRFLQWPGPPGPSMSGTRSISTRYVASGSHGVNCAMCGSMRQTSPRALVGQIDVLARTLQFLARGR